MLPTREDGIWTRKARGRHFLEMMERLLRPGKYGKVRAMKIKTILLGAALAATVPTAAQSHFVIFDSLLRVPALCYPLPPGWTGMGWVKWNVPAR